jgi:hypothetical protein
MRIDVRIVLGLLVGIYGFGTAPFDAIRPSLINRPVKAFYDSTNASVAVLAAGLSPMRMRGGVSSLAHGSPVGGFADRF